MLILALVLELVHQGRFHDNTTAVMLVLILRLVLPSPVKTRLN